MRRFLLVFICIAFFTSANAQDFSASRLIDMLSGDHYKIEKQVTGKKYRFTGSESFGDTVVRTYQYRPVIKNSKKKTADSIARRMQISSLKETFTLTYQTTSPAEYTGIIDKLKKDSFYCEYEKDSTVKSHLYQHEDYTADATVINEDGTNWYGITFFKKEFPLTRDVHFAEDLLDFTSHEYLVYYFGEKHVKKDVYYFSKNDIVKCSVLFNNTKRQVIFVWRDGLNRRNLDNILIGGAHKLKSQEGYDKFTAENDWLTKSGIHPGMPLFELRTLNEGNFTFCGGNSPNPGLIFSDSEGKVDFKNTDIILGCMNCTDDKFLASPKLNADKAMLDGRILFVLTMVLYPIANGIFN
ncbi:MAG: hypothetical protein JWR61_3957 [Ferruginibacter sp.]|uniref:hypothetical protein n=1 Tax=Ferruginibacter sp. TaxID=1940288 RepID=UPI00265B37B3|nr:hypothetical protein [Ferruginibacter sp.]MDB5279002.1 hypothetical protein [Ferruginibacter sp.]